MIVISILITTIIDIITAIIVIRILILTIVISILFLIISTTSISFSVFFSVAITITWLHISDEPRVVRGGGVNSFGCSLGLVLAVVSCSSPLESSR